MVKLIQMRQMKIILLIITVMFFSNSCRKCIFPDEELTLSKEPYTGHQLRIDGYYYSEFGSVYRIYFLYYDGVILSADFLTESLVEQEQSSIYESFKSTKKINWGVFNIDNDIIQVEKWYPSSGGGMPVSIHKGEILNDTTFIMTISIHSKTGKQRELNETYHFKAFSPKPDSTNSFIP